MTEVIFDTPIREPATPSPGDDRDGGEHDEHGSREAPRHERTSVADEPARASALARALAAVGQAVTVATLLRTLGATAIVASLSLYLLQGFDMRGDLSRVLTLLGQSALLAAAGLAVGFALREPKGARVFLMLCLVSVPANFAVLGAMIYSIAPLDGGQLGVQYPAFATWQAGSFRELWQALAAGLALLLPITVFAFAVLARRRAVPLSLGLLAGSAVLLVPVRLPSVTIVATGVLLIAVVTFVARTRRETGGTTLPMTFEERLAHALLLLPPGILLGRTMLVHGVDLNAGLPLAMAAWYGLDSLLAHARGTVRRQRLVAVLGAASAVATAGLSVPLLADHLDVGALLVLFAVIAGGLCTRLVHRTDEPLARRLVGALCSVALLAPVAGFVVFGLSGSTGGETFAAAVVCLAVIVHGVLEGRRGRSIAGALALLALLWTQAGVVTAFVLGGGWGGLAAAGVATVVAGSLLERFGPPLKLRFERARTAREDRASARVPAGPIGAAEASGGAAPS